MRYIGVFFGSRLTEFLEQFSEAYNDSETEIDQIRDLILAESGYAGKISQYHVFAGPLRFLGWKLYLYFLTFTIKAIANVLSRRFDLYSEKSPGANSVLNKLRFCFVARNIHFCAFNMVLVDGFFFSSRTLSHLRNDTISDYVNLAVSGFMILTLSTDLFENVKTSEELSYVTNQLHFDTIEKWEEGFCKKLLPQNKKNDPRRIEQKI